jgi:hypothetical protein
MEASVYARSRKRFLWILAFNLVLIAVAILSGPFHPVPGKATPTRYFGEGKYPTAVSVLQLAAVGVLCALVWKRQGCGVRATAPPGGGGAAPAFARHIWLLISPARSTHG